MDWLWWVGRGVGKADLNAVCGFDEMEIAGWAVGRECCGSVKWGLIEISRL